MPFRIDNNVISLEGHCVVEEAEPLFEAMRGVDEPIFDLGKARTLHAAVVQLVLASSGFVRTAPTDRWLAACFRDRLLP
jgi:hypothetical protein